MEEKTIVGIASAAGGGIGIIRVSGSESMKIVDSIFHPGKFNNEENDPVPLPVPSCRNRSDRC